jgi:signal transduction histidine kinase
MTMTTGQKTTDFDVDIYTEGLPNNYAIAIDLPEPVIPTSNLIEQLFQLSMLEDEDEDDQIFDSYTFFCLDDVIADAISLISRVATPKGVQMIFEPNNAAFVYADEDMVYSMTQNLISNAVNFSQRGETVRIASRIERDLVKVCISNSKVGISEEKLLQLFQHQLFQLASTIPNEVETELLLCHRLAEKNNGKLSVTSGSGQGIQFTFTLPRVKDRKRVFLQKC